MDQPQKIEGEMILENIAMTQALIASLGANGFDASASVCALLTAATTLIHQNCRSELRLATLNAFLAPTIQEWSDDLAPVTIQ